MKLKTPTPTTTTVLLPAARNRELLFPLLWIPLAANWIIRGSLLIITRPGIGSSRLDSRHFRRQSSSSGERFGCGTANPTAVERYIASSGVREEELLIRVPAHSEIEFELIDVECLWCFTGHYIIDSLSQCGTFRHQTTTTTSAPCYPATLPSSAISHQLVGTYLHISAQIDNGAGIISS